RRIKKELEDLEKGPPSPCSAGPILVNVCYWKGTIVGPSGTPYAGGVFLLSIDFASEYPFRPTKVAFMTRVYHPNIKSDGTISLNILAEKQYPDKEYLTRLVQLSIRSLLDNPNPDDYCEPEIAHVYKTNRVRYERTAREWTRKYAM
ncbi:ubiquitin-conjugating enzyme/RWD-like protein, partial [Hyaloscypha finlandica]